MGQAGERHAKRAARDDITGPQSLKSEVRAGPVGCPSLGADVCGCTLHVFLGMGLNAMRCGVIQ